MFEKFIESRYTQPIIFIIIIFLLLIGKFYAQTPQQVYDACVEADIKHPEIVTKQFVLETGWGKCTACSMDHNNLFGFYYKGSYIEYDSWEECILAYKKWQDKWYDGRDYYDFLECLWKHSDGTCVRYAESPDYIEKLKSIEI